MSSRDMDCARVRDALLAGTTPAGAWVEAHSRECPACAELLGNQGRLGRALSASEAPAQPDPELWKSLEGVLAAEKGPRAWLRSRATPVRLLIVALVGSFLVVLGGQPADDTVRPVRDLLGWLAAFGVAALACLWVLVAPLGRPRPPAAMRVALVGTVLALPLAYALSGTEASAASGSFAEQALGCFLYGTILALPFLGAAWAFERSDYPWLTRLVGVGAIGGLIANLALALHCPDTRVAHLVLGHAAVGFAFASLGALWTLVRTKAAS